MTPEVREDPRDPLLLFADRHCPGEELKSVAEAGFEAGLGGISQNFDLSHGPNWLGWAMEIMGS